MFLYIVQGFENELKVTNITQTVLLNTQEVFQTEVRRLCVKFIPYMDIVIWWYSYIV